MPIRPHLRKFYRGAAWAAVRARILQRAAHGCERCGKPNHAVVTVMRDGTGRWCGGVRDGWRDGEGRPTARPTLVALAEARQVRVVLTIAHLNHLAGDDRDENLQALCQRCHLAHDQRWHQAQARRTRAARAGQAWLIDAALPASVEDVREDTDGEVLESTDRFRAEAAG
ncbi:MAG: HNH endonuclease [Bryobacterales bacterium]|jgi:5-methylcytosine-specific restriction endonuclease McrA|nr:HNH endonuclease [Bryobacterales bacterium]